MLRAWVGLAVFSCYLNLAVAAEPEAKGRSIDFVRDIAPILQQNCVDCHGPTLQMAALRLDQRQFVLGANADPDLVKAGNSGESLLVQRLTDAKRGILMPPSFPFFPGEKVGLAAAQIATLQAWIDQGAAWPAGVSLVPAAAANAETAAIKALFAAIRAGDAADAATKLIDGDKALVNGRDRNGSTPLMQAAIYADTNLLRLLLERGADVNAADHAGATALMRGAGDFDKVQLLLDRGAKTDVKSNMGRTPLLIAASFPGNVKSVELLISRGANVNEQDPFAETCLTAASKRGDAEMVKLLLAKGANVMAGSRPPLVWAAEEGNFATLACLFDGGADKVPPVVSAALSSAASRGPIEAVRLLLDRGADPNAPSMIAGYTPLMWAAYSENVSAETVKLLLAKGAKPEAKGANGETALSLAQKRGRSAIVELLGGMAEETKATESESKATEPAQLPAAIDKSLVLLQRCGPQFFAKSGCVACHQQSMASLAAAEARKHGVKVDEQTAREQVQITAITGRAYRERFLQRVDHPAGSATSTGYILLGLAAENYPADEITDAMVFELAGRQHTDGSWTAFGHRPPIEYSRIAATALGLHSLQLYGPPGMKASLTKQIEKAKAWLLAATPVANAEHAFRLLGLAWAGCAPEQLSADIVPLLKAQNGDGGWSQQPTLPSDAFATGLALYALNIGGQVAASHPAHDRGVQYLRRTQLPDGSWYVRSRAFPFQPYFESGFPHGHDQWISATATGFATIALLRSMAVGGEQ